MENLETLDILDWEPRTSEYNEFVQKLIDSKIDRKDKYELRRKDITLLKNNSNNIRYLLSNLKFFKHQFNWSLKNSKWNVEISIIFTEHPSNQYKRTDNVVYFIMILKINDIEYYYNHAKPSYKYITNDPMGIVMKEFKNWKYNPLLSKLLNVVQNDFWIQFFDDIIRL